MVRQYSSENYIGIYVCFLKRWRKKEFIEFRLKYKIYFLRVVEARNLCLTEANHPIEMTCLVKEDLLSVMYKFGNKFHR